MRLIRTSLLLFLTTSIFCFEPIAAISTPSLEAKDSSPLPEISKSESSTINRDIGRTPVIVDQTECYGYEIRALAPLNQFNSRSMLISIDKKDIKDYSLTQIEDLLSGPVGSKVNLDLMLANGKIKTLTVTREAPKNQDLWQRDAIGAFENYDNRSSGNWNQEYIEYSLDLQARATQNLNVITTRAWTSKRSNALSSAALPAALSNYEVGNIADGDANLLLCLSTQDPDVAWKLGQNRQTLDSIRTLLAVGRAKEASKILSFMEIGPGDLGGHELATEELGINLLKTDRDLAFQTVESFLKKSKESTPGTWFVPPFFDFYEKAGDYRKALSGVENTIKLREQNSSTDPSTYWLSTVSISNLLMRKARLHSLLGETTSASESLKSALTKFSLLPAELLANLEIMPGIFPRPGQLQNALALAQSGKVLPELPEVASSQSSFAFPDIRACHDAIACGDKESASLLINNLTNLYKKEAPQKVAERRGRQSLHCSILTLAREITNRGWHELAASVLQSLKQNMQGREAFDLTRAYLEAECVFNATKQKKDRTENWSRLQSLLHVKEISEENSADQKNTTTEETSPAQKPTRKDLSFAGRLRVLALIYYYAGETERAQFFLNQALVENDIERKQHDFKPAATSTKVEAQRTLMLLDSACVAAKTGHFEKANAYIIQISHRDALQDEAYQGTFLELSSIYEKCNQIEKAIEILKSVRAKTNASRAHQQNETYGNFNFMLVRLLRKKGELKEARQVAYQTVLALCRTPNAPQCALVAELAEDECDFAEAAKYYTLASSTNIPVLFSIDEQKFYKKKALECAIKAKSFDKAALSKLYVQRAEMEIEDENVKDAIAFYQHALEAMPVVSPSKLALMTKVSNLQCFGYDIDEPLRPAKIKKPVPSIPGPTSQEAMAYQSPPTPEEIRVHLDHLEQIAKTAEQNHLPGARMDWVRLSRAEITDGDWQAGFRHAQHGLELFTIKDVHEHGDPLGDRTNIANYLTFKGHSDAAEKLLLESVVKAQKLAGDSSIATHAQLADLFIFYVGQKRFSDAMPIIERVLNCDLSTGDTVTKAESHSNCGWGWPQAASAVDILSKIDQCLNTIIKSNPSFVMQVQQKILDAQTKTLKPDDEHIMPTLAKLGDVSFVMGNHDVADKFYARAFVLSRKYHKGEYAVRLVGEHFIENLRSVGKVDEAEALSESPWEGVYP